MKKSNKLKLVFPRKKYLASYTEAYNEDVVYCNDALEMLCPPDIVLAQAKRCRHIDSDDSVPSTMLWLVEGRKFVGCVDIRHRLNDALTRLGGHIGYEIRYDNRNKGYGTKLLRMALEYAKRRLAIDRVLLTCLADNIPSVRVIEKNGGALENKIDTNIGGRPVTVCRYWITL